MALNLDLEVAEVNMVLGGLGNLPYGQVEPLITKIRNQVIPQLPTQEAPTDDQPTETTSA